MAQHVNLEEFAEWLADKQATRSGSVTLWIVPNSKGSSIYYNTLQLAELFNKDKKDGYKNIYTKQS